MAGEFVGVLVLSFADGGDDEEQLLIRGTQEECERAADALSAVAYNGNRPKPQARYVVAHITETVLQ